MSFSIGDLHPNTPYLFADIVELAVMIGYIRGPELHKNDLEALVATGSINSDEIDVEVGGLDDLSIVSEDDVSGRSMRDRRERQLEDALTHLAYRAGSFDWYPFVVAGETIRLRRRLTGRHRVYRLLLACSRLKSFHSKGLHQAWAQLFTRLCKSALAGLLPQHATVRMFDANSEDRAIHYSHSLSLALSILGTELGALSINSSECSPKSESGDAGLDLVGFVDFSDGAATNHAILGQCSAQWRNWPQKTLEAHSVRFRSFFQMLADQTCTMFTPLCYRDSDGKWYDNRSATGVLLLDRGRIISLLEKQGEVDRIVNHSWFREFEQRFIKLTA
jgi:hypothetical protein